MKRSAILCQGTVGSFLVDLRHGLKAILLLCLAVGFSPGANGQSTPVQQYCYDGDCFPSYPQAVAAVRSDSRFAGWGSRLELVSVEVEDALEGEAEFEFAVRNVPFTDIGEPTYLANLGSKGSGAFGCAPTAPDPYDNRCFNEAALIEAAEEKIVSTYPNCTVSGTVPRSGDDYNVDPSSRPSSQGGTLHTRLEYGSKYLQTTMNCTGSSGPFTRSYSWNTTKMRRAECPAQYDPARGLVREETLATGRYCKPDEYETAVIRGTILQVASCAANPNPCHPATGDKSRAETDFVFAGRPFVRHYHSRTQLASSAYIGAGWTHEYGERLLESDDNVIYRVSAQGEYETFKPIDSTRYRAENSADLILEKLASGEYTLQLPDGSARDFDADGRLIALRDPAAPSNDVALIYSGVYLVNVVDQQGRAITFHYDNGRVDRIDLPDGQSVAYGYDADLNLVSVDYGNGAVRQYHYHEAGMADATFTNHLTGITSEDGRRHASFAYDQFGRVQSSALHGENGLVAVTTLAYDTADQVSVLTETGDTRVYTMQPGLYRRMTAITDGSGTTARTYDADGRVQAVIGKRGVITTYGYTDAHLSSITEGDGTPQQRRTLLQRDGANRIVRREVQGLRDGTMEAERIESMVYDSSGRLAFRCLLDPDAAAAASYVCGSQGSAPEGVRQTAYAYCTSADVSAGDCPYEGFLKSMDGPRTDLSDVVTYAYYASDDPACATAPATCAHRKGDLWKTTNALGQVIETLAYDGAGRPLSIETSDGVVTDLEYNTRGWLTARKVRGADNASETDDRITAIEYWPTGLVKKITDPDGAFTSYTYDAAHRLTDVTDNAGNGLHYTLDNAGNRLQEDTRDPGGTLRQTLSRVYNQLGQLVTLADAQANPTDFTYDADGNPDTVTDALGRVTDSDHGPLNRLKQALQDVGGIQAQSQIAYDALDNPTQVTDPNGLQTTYAYNGFGDLVQQTSPDTGSASYTYDSAGNRKTRTDARGITATYTYDALNRPTSIAWPDPALDVAFAYDAAPAACQAGETFAAGRLSQMADASGSTQYCYGRFGNLVRKVQTTNGQAFTVRYAYTKAGRLSTVTYPGGAVVDYVRNALGQVTEVGVTPAGGIRQPLLHQATYYPFGPSAGWVYGNGRSLARTYDLDYRPQTILDGASGGLDLGYGFDAVGNLDVLTTALGATPLLDFGYDALGRLTQTQDGPTGTPIETYTYDATGNRTSFQNSAGMQTYVYAATSHRLASAGGIARTYDALGSTTGVGGTAREFVYDDTGRMRQAKAGGTVVASYAYNGKGERVRKAAGANHTYTLYDETGRWLGDYDGSGNPLQQAIWLDDLPVGLLAGPTQQLHYVEPDHLGTPRTVIDPIRDVTVWKWDAKSEAFGNSPPHQDPDADGTAFVLDMRFPGQRYDGATGLNYNYFRDYNPSTGRYVQSDPIGLEGGISTYAYVGSNPISNVDPLGLQYYGPGIAQPLDPCTSGAVAESAFNLSPLGALNLINPDATSLDQASGTFAFFGYTFSYQSGRLDEAAQQRISTLQKGVVTYPKQQAALQRGIDARQGWRSVLGSIGKVLGVLGLAVEGQNFVNNVRECGCEQ